VSFQLNDTTCLSFTMRTTSPTRQVARRTFGLQIPNGRNQIIYKQQRPRPRPGKVEVYGAIIHSRSTDKYCLVEGRSSGKYSFPKGHVKEDESPFECVGREIGEEIGIDSLPMPQKGIPLRVGYYYFFDIPNEWPLNPRDMNEIGTAGWYSLEEMESMNLNIDANVFRTQQSRSNIVIN